MRKYILVVLLVGAILLLCGCNANKTSEQQKYKRISFESESLDDSLGYLNDDTIIVSDLAETFSSQIPIYRISECNISDQQFQQMLGNLKIAEDPTYPYDDFMLEGNTIYINLIDYTDYSRGYFDMTDWEVEELAWEVFNKIPFMEGEYECVGIQNKYTCGDKDGEHISRAGVGFCRVLDGVRVVGGETCVLYFDGSGLVEMSIKMYDYEKIGMMDLIPLTDAKEKLKTPDDFDFEMGEPKSNEVIDTLHVEQVKLRLINQYSKGCAILQPIYYFIGTAIHVDTTETDFSSKVIAIPESMTYEE